MSILLKLLKKPVGLIQCVKQCTLKGIPVTFIALPAEHWWYNTIFTQHSHQMHFTLPMEWNITKHSYDNFLLLLIFCSDIWRTCNKHIHNPMFFNPLECNVLDCSSVLTHKMVNLYLTQMYGHTYFCIK